MILTSIMYQERVKVRCVPATGKGYIRTLMYQENHSDCHNIFVVALSVENDLRLQTFVASLLTLKS